MRRPLETCSLSRCSHGSINGPIATRSEIGRHGRRIRSNSSGTSASPAAEMAAKPPCFRHRPHGNRRSHDDRLGDMDRQASIACVHPPSRWGRVSTPESKRDPPGHRRHADHGSMDGTLWARCGIGPTPARRATAVLGIGGGLVEHDGLIYFGSDDHLHIRRGPSHGRYGRLLRGPMAPCALAL